MSLDQLLEECRIGGWQLSLFQYGNVWQAQLRQPLLSGNIFKGHAIGPTPADAIRDAMAAAKEVDLTSTLDGWKAFVKPDKRSLDLLAELGLLPEKRIKRI